MNAKDRKELQKVVDSLNAWSAKLEDENIEINPEEITSALESLQEEVEQKASDEQEKFDNMSEGLQESERGQQLQEAADALNNIMWPVVDDFNLNRMEERSDLADQLQNVVADIEGLL